MNLGLIYCAWDADKNKQQLQKFLFGISMTKTKYTQQKILPAGYHTANWPSVTVT